MKKVSAIKKPSAGQGLRNFRMDREEAVKEQVSLLRYFRTRNKNYSGSETSEAAKKEKDKEESELEEKEEENMEEGKDTLDKTNPDYWKTKSPQLFMKKKSNQNNMPLRKAVWLPSEGRHGEKRSIPIKPLSKLLFVEPPSPETEEENDSGEDVVKEEVEEEQQQQGDWVAMEGSEGSMTTNNLLNNMKRRRSSSEADPDSQDGSIKNDENGSSSSEGQGGDISTKKLLNNMKRALSSSDVDQDSQDSPIIRVKSIKRARRVASSDEEEEEIDNKREKLNGHNSSTDNLEDMPDNETLDKYLQMWESVYTFIPKIEFLDVFKEYNWDIKNTMIRLGVLNKEYKIEQKKGKLQDVLMRKKEMAEKRREIKEIKLAGKELEVAARKAVKEKLKCQKESRKAKVPRREVEADVEEEEEDDYQFGGVKVYDSDEEDEEDEDGENEDGEGENGKEKIDVEDPQLKGDRDLVLQFFNDGTVGELSGIGGCSKKKAEVIISARPFINWADIVYKFKIKKYISPDLLNHAKTALHVRNTVQRLMKRCENIARDMACIVEGIVSGQEDAGVSCQPASLNPEMKLKGYQLIGLNWLVLMHNQGLNGVLADEMGLGKTIQAISFLAYIKEVEAPEIFSLIVVPSSTLENWGRELEQWCPELEVLQYHGSQEERRSMKFDILNNSFDEIPDIILTTYNMVCSSTEDRALFKKVKFHTLILDEAHMLKNMASQRYENLMKIKAQRRVLLTGTPLQNNLVELMSILIFVMPQLFDSKKEELKRVFSMFPKSEEGSSKSRFERERIEQAKRIMKPFFLRRLKCDVLKDLPPKEDQVVYTAMSERQRKIYQDVVATYNQRARQHKLDLEQMNMKQLSELEEMEATTGSPKKKGKDKDASSNIVMTLRKIANHPLLTRKFYSNTKIKEIAKILKKTSHQDSVLEYITEDLSVMSDFEINSTCRYYPAVRKYSLTEELILNSGKLKQLDIILPRLKEEGARVLIFSQFVIVLNILEAYIKIRGHSYRRFDGSTQVSERQELIDQFTEDENIFLFLLSTRAGGLGVNLTAANTVILHDIDFNPYNDKQAEDRCHRVGQTKPVKIIRLVSEGTIEDGMMQIAQEKLQLERDVTGLEEDTHKKVDVLSLLKVALGLVKPDLDNSSSKVAEKPTKEDEDSCEAADEPVKKEDDSEEASDTVEEAGNPLEIDESSEESS